MIKEPIQQGILIKPSRCQWFRQLCWVLILTFSGQVIGEDVARATTVAEPQNIIMPLPGTLLAASPVASLPTLKAISIDKNDPFKIHFVVDADQSPNGGQEQVNLLVKYFLTFLAIPERDLWVNLSPYEKNRIIPSVLEATTVGRDMLAEDYILKQLASSLTYPDHQLGKEFWTRIYHRVKAEYGSTSIPVSNFNKIWVVPDKVVVYEGNGSAFISESRLKVMIEEDYLSTVKNGHKPTPLPVKKQGIDQLSVEITREIIIPELEREVNEGKYFAPLRQMYNSLILAIWFKKRLKEGLINQVYSDQKKMSGITLNDGQVKQKIYALYLKAVKKGAYNYIREDYDEQSKSVVPRKYFAGGFSFAQASDHIEFKSAAQLSDVINRAQSWGKQLYSCVLDLNPLGGLSKKMIIFLMLAAVLTMGSAAAHAGGVEQPPSGFTPPPGILPLDHHDAQMFDTAPPAPVQVDLQQEEISALKADIAHQQSVLKGKLLRGDIKQGSYLMGLSSIGYEEGKLKKLEKQLEKKRQFTPPKHQAVFIENGLTIPALPVVTAVDLPVETPSADAKILPVAEKPMGMKSVEAPSTVEPVKAVVPPVAASPVVGLPKADAPSVVTPSIDQEDLTSKIGPYHLSAKVIPIPVEEKVLAKHGGIVVDSDRNLDLGVKKYKQGTMMFAVMDPELKSRIDQLNADIVIQQKRLGELKQLAATQQATFQEISVAQQKLDDSLQKLARANQEAVAGAVTAPRDLKIKVISVRDGMKVAEGAVLFSYDTPHRVQLNFKVPLSVNYFSKIKDLTINGQRVQGIVSAHWSLDARQREAEVSVVVDLLSPLPQQELVLEATFVAPASPYPQLNSVAGDGQTIAAVGELTTAVLRAPADGSVRFLVHDGQMVEEGDVVALVEPQHYLEEYRSIQSALNSIDIQLSQAVNPDGTFLIKRDKLDELKSQKATLVSKLETLKEQLARLYVRASHRGIVTSLAEGQSQVFRSQDELMKIYIGEAVIGGDVNGADNLVLVSKELKVANGDAVLIETPQNVRLPGRIIAVNQNLNNSSMDLGDSQDIQLRVVDQQHILAPHLPIKVRLLKDTEKKDVEGLLRSIEKNNSQSGSAGSPPPPPAKVNAPLPSQFGGPIVASIMNQNNAINTLAAEGSLNSIAASQGLSLNLSEVSNLVHGNRLVAGAEAIEMLKKKEAEAFPSASRLSLSGGVWMKDGKLFFSGGVKGMFSNLVGGGVSSGNAIGAAVPLVYQLSGSVIDIVSGKVTKETALAVQMTQIAYHHMETAVYQQVTEAQRLLADIGTAEEGIRQSQSLLQYLEKARDGMLAREAGGFSLITERDQVEKDAQMVKAHLLELQGKKEAWTVALNALIGQPTTDMHHLISTKLPWNKQFTGVNTADEEAMRQRLIGENSTNPRMKQAMAAGKAVDMTVRLQGLERLPTVNMSSIYINDKTGLNPLYDLTSGAVVRTSGIKERANNVGQIDIPVWDQTVNTKEKILALEQQAAQDNLQRTRIALTEELGKTCSNLRNLSAKIQVAESSYANALKVWELKASRPDIYLPYQMIAERLEVNRSLQDLIELKGQYFKEESNLRKMGLLPQENAAAGTMGWNVPQVQVVPLPTVVPDTFADDYQRQSASLVRKPQTGALSAGVVNYPANDPANIWALMQALPLEALGDVLINDSNVLVRKAALDHLLAEHQQDKGFLKKVGYVALNSPHVDVVYGILKFMAERKDHDLRFFVQLIHEASAQQKPHCPALMKLASQFLSDSLILHPDTLKVLSDAQFDANSGQYPALTPAIAQEVFLNFLAGQGENSIAASNFLQSDYWLEDDLARIYATVEGTGLAGLIHDALMRKIVLENIDDVFRQDKQDDLGFFPWDDGVVSYVQNKENAKATKSFLESSPEWRKMGQYIHPDLFARAQQRATELIAQNKHLSSAPFLEQPAPSVSPQDGLIAFNKLGLRFQRDHVAQSHNIPELGRIFAYAAPVRELALERLMADGQGRVAALEAYVNSNDPTVMKLIEDRSWDALKTDAVALKDPVSTGIIRAGLFKLYKGTGNQDFLNTRLATFTSIELPSLQDPRGNEIALKAIKIIATQRAVEAIEVRVEQKPLFWNGQSKLYAGERQVLDDAKRLINQQGGLDKLDAYFTKVEESNDKKRKAMAHDIMALRDQIAKKIKGNDQSVPMLTVKAKIFYGLVAAFIAGLFGRGFYARFKRRQALSEDILRRLNEQLLNRTDRPTDGLLVPEPRDLYVPAVESFQSWRHVISRWATSTELRPQDMARDMNLILNNTEEILKKMPYSPDLIWTTKTGVLKNHAYQENFSYFNLLALNTLMLLKGRLSSVDDELDRQRLQQAIDLLQESIGYVTQFLRIIEFRGIIEKVMSYKFNTNDWREKWGVNWLSRILVLNQYQWKKSEALFEQELPSLIDKGNALMDGLYQQKDAIINQSKDLLSRVTDNGNTSYDSLTPTASREYRVRSFNSRIPSLLSFVTVLCSVVGVAFGIPWLVLGGLSTAGLLGLGLSYFIYWKPHLKIQRMEWSNDISLVADRLKKELGGVLNTTVTNSVDDSTQNDKERVINLETKEGEKQLAVELDKQNSPGVDMIVLVAHDHDKEDFLRDFEKKNRFGKKNPNGFIRENLPVEVMSSEYQGSGNAYLDVMRRVKEKYQQNAHPTQLRKPWNEMRVMYIFHGEDAIYQDAPTQEALLKNAIINGYRAARRDTPSVDQTKNEAPGQNHFIIYTRDPYFGPIPLASANGIRILTSRVKKTMLTMYGWVNAQFSKTEYPRVREVLQGLDIDELAADEPADDPGYREGRTLNHLREKYQVGNDDLEQYPVSRHMTILGADAISMFERIADFLEEKNLWKSTRLHLTADLLIPVIMSSNLSEAKKEKEITEYLFERLKWADLKIGRSGGAGEVWRRDAQSTLSRIYDFIIQNNTNPVDVTAFMAPSKLAATYHLAGQESKTEAKRYKSALAATKGAQSLLRTNPAMNSQEAVDGGIDLSKTRESVSYQQAVGSDPADATGHFNNSMSVIFQSFQGFDFKVIQYQPILNPTELFLGRAVDKSGAWFS